MGKHTKRDDTDKPKPRDTPSRGSGRGWLAPEDVQAAEKLIKDTNRKLVVDAATDLTIRRYGHDGHGGTR